MDPKASPGPLPRRISARVQASPIMEMAYPTTVAPAYSHAAPPPSPTISAALLASRTRLIKSVRLTRAISKLTTSMLTDPTNVALLILGNVSHKTCRISAVAKAPSALQLKDFAHAAVDAGLTYSLGSHPLAQGKSVNPFATSARSMRGKSPSDHYLVLGQLTLIG